jgi:elongation factor Ts
MDCKRALVEVGGDSAAAERRLKEMGLAAAAKRYRCKKDRKEDRCS